MVHDDKKKRRKAVVANSFLALAGVSAIVSIVTTLWGDNLGLGPADAETWRYAAGGIAAFSALWWGRLRQKAREEK